MNKKKQFILLSLPLLVSLASCGVKPIESSEGSSSAFSDISTESNLSVTPISDISSNSETNSNDSSSLTPVTADEASKITDLSLEGISYSDNVFAISAAGEYTFTGEFEGNIVVNAPDDAEVVIVLNGFKISSALNSPILCWQADELKVKVQKGTTNYVLDNRAHKNEDEDDDTQGNGAIYSKCDTKFTGKGTLVVNGNYKNGIHSTKDLELKTTQTGTDKIQVTAYDNAFKGNDSITVESGNIIAISTGGDGFKTEDTDVSSKGNHRGTIEILGGTIDIYSCCDGIDASYNAVIKESTDSSGNVITPTLNIITNKYSEYSSEVASQSESVMYLKYSQNLKSKRFAICFYDSEGKETWKNVTFKTSQSNGRNGTSYIYEVDRPSSAVSFNIYLFDSSITENKAELAEAKTAKASAINENFDMLTVGVNSSTITTGSWSTYSTTTQQQGGPGGPGGWGGPGGFEEGNTDKSDYSAKGIKADNIIEISGGNINIKAYDDGIHANYGDAFDTDPVTYGEGDVTISGGNIEIYAADDGIHADRYLNVEGGNIDITYAYEGLEGTVVNIKDGDTKVYGVDDGLNCSKKAGDLAAAINVSGGVIDTTVYGNDVDAIDSNGTFTQTGGIIITKGGTGGMSTGLDVDGTAKITGGTFICFGKPEKTPTATGLNSKTFSGSYSAGTYRITNGTIDLTTTTKYSYSVIYVWTDGSTNFTFTKQ